VCRSAHGADVDTGCYLCAFYPLNGVGTFGWPSVGGREGGFVGGLGDGIEDGGDETEERGEGGMDGGGNGGWSFTGPAVSQR
jgi:hypothetical protein